MREYGLDEVVDMEAVEGALELPRGVPTPIIGSATKVTVNGRRVELALGPRRMGGDWLVPAGPLVEALEAEMEVGPRGSYVAIRRGENRLFLSPGVAIAIYISHLAFILCLFATFPYSKFAHLVYRTLAMVHELMVNPSK